VYQRQRVRELRLLIDLSSSVIRQGDGCCAHRLAAAVVDRNEPGPEGVFPDCVPRAMTAPGFDRADVRARAASNPREELTHRGVNRRSRQHLQGHTEV
jgi:hypothetical protein